VVSVKLLVSTKGMPGDSLYHFIMQKTAKTEILERCRKISEVQKS